MKKLILFTLIFIFNFHFVFGYELTPQDENVLNKIRGKLWELSKDKDLDWFNQYEKKMIDRKEKNNNINKSNKIVDEILSEISKIKISLQQDNSKGVSGNNLDNYLLNDEDYKKEDENTIKFKISFFEENGKNITTDTSIPDECKKYYNEINEIGQKYDFPTELIIATWWMETGCRLTNPLNGWGPYQITSAYYNPGNIDINDFKNYTIDFIKFSKNKWNNFSKNKKFKEQFNKDNVNISYNNYTLKDLQLHSILFNGVTKETTLENNIFANNNLHSGVVKENYGDGIVTKLLKIINWKYNN